MKKANTENTHEEASSASPDRTVLSSFWYKGPHKDVILYLMIAIFFVELIVGGVAFFYGVMHAAPEVPGGPPMAQFPWLAWAVAAILAPVGLLLIVHLSGFWVARFLGREEQDGDAGAPSSASTRDEEQVPERLRRFYAIIRSAPTVVVLVGILLLGAALLFVDGAFTALMRLGDVLSGYIPWIVGSLAAMIALCYLVHRWFVYRHHRMQQEYEYRRDVLQRTGIILVDKGCVPLPQADKDLPPALDAAVIVESSALPEGSSEAAEGRVEDASADNGEAGAGSEESADQTVPEEESCSSDTKN
jgi:membrane protein implicated in regulation of membrane protease activity